MHDRQQCHKNIPQYSKVVCVLNSYGFRLYMYCENNTDGDKHDFCDPELFFLIHRKVLVVLESVCCILATQSQKNICLYHFGHLR